MNTLLVLLMLATPLQNQHPLQVFNGTWKVEGKETYENWEMKNGNLEGSSYKMINGEMKTSETLMIRKEGAAIYFDATVPDQNEGKTISFRLNEKETEIYSFENPEHDFPKKIKYKFISDEKVHVSVLGEDDKGFSFTMIRQ